MINLLNIECNRLELLKALKKINHVLRKSKKARGKTVIEIMIKKNEAEIRHPERVEMFDCNANAVVKLFVPYSLLITLVQKLKSELFIATIEKGLIYLDDMMIRSKEIRLEEPGSQEQSSLPDNISKLELLSFRKIYHNRDLERKNLLTHLEKEEEKLMKSVAQAEDLLKDYGISAELLYSVIDSKLKQVVTEKLRVN